MAEAEDVLVDAARHATVYAQDLWRRHRPARDRARPLHLHDVATRIGLLVCAAVGRSFPMQVAQPAVPRSWLHRLMLRELLPEQPWAVPATDGGTLWLPGDFGPDCDAAQALERFRLQALRQAIRAVRGGAAMLAGVEPPLLRELFLLGEARAADADLVRRLPGLAGALNELRIRALERRPRAASFPAPLRDFETFVCQVIGDPEQRAPRASDPGQVLRWASEQLASRPKLRMRDSPMLWRDEWTGDLRLPGAGNSAVGESDLVGPGPPTRSARLRRRPEVRKAQDDEDDVGPGAFTVQSAQPNEAVEDPMGMERPIDRDQATAAEEFADALSELPQARLVALPGKPREVLLSDELPPASARSDVAAIVAGKTGQLNYPEWDYRVAAYRDPGTTVREQTAGQGPSAWVEQTLAQRASMLQEIRRRFEMLRPQRVRLRRQLDGNALDIDAWTSAQADYRAGLPLDQRVYQSERRGRRDMAIMLLVDVSGSTDSWIAPGLRIIDVEREALLLVCVGLEGMGAPYSVLAFSGEGPQAVVLRPIKGFREHYGPQIALRIAGLEPEHYTRAGAAIRHATAVLSREPAAHRLLVLLSDGKPNDVDHYEGRYGVEDMRQAVVEARLQGISPFCLTIDRQAAAYLPLVFGPHHYQLLPRADLLPSALLNGLRHLVSV